MRRLALILPLAACIPEPDLPEIGYSNGYAVGYTTTCGGTAPKLRAAWDQPAYGAAFARGVPDGIRACLTEKGDTE